MSLDDESPDEEISYSNTSVLLGYASQTPTGDDISFLGGSPTWLGETKPSYDLVLCKVCRGPLSQLLQINGELPEHFPTHDRRLHILTCRKKACYRKPGSIRGLRATRQLSESSSNTSLPSAPVQVKTYLGNDIFGGGPSASIGANPFSKSSTQAPATNPFSAKAQTTTPTYAFTAASSSPKPVGKPVQPWPANAAIAKEFPKLYLDADYESLDLQQTLPSSLTTQVGTFQEETVTNGESSSTQEDPEVFESTIDKTFQRFADRLAQNPEQVLRYEFDGLPLLYSAVDEVGKIFHDKTSVKVSTAKRAIPGCGNCSKSRTFELQLAPYAIIELEGDDLSLDGMDWGTIILGVCQADCQVGGIATDQVGYLEEWIGVQWEESKR